MSETKFTPGPWAKDKYGQLKNPDGNPVDVWGCGLSIASRSTETEANAALIAAAPDLYAALEERNALVLRAQSNIAHFHDGLLTAREFEHEMTGLFTGSDVDTSAHAAIAKARGES